RHDRANPQTGLQPLTLQSKELFFDFAACGLARCRGGAVILRAQRLYMVNFSRYTTWLKLLKLGRSASLCQDCRTARGESSGAVAKRWFKVQPIDPLRL
ncbi:MAG: hypothetical protein ACRD19_02485, partial [Terriglobia bacterium]